MLFLNDEIETALKNDTILTNLLGGELIYEFFECGDRDISYPRIIFEEISNVPCVSYDNDEKYSRITYRISVCASEKLIDIVSAVIRVMISIDFVRFSAENIYGLPVGISGKVISFIINKECI